MEKVYLKAKEWLLKAMLTLSVVALGISPAMAQTGTAEEPLVLENGVEYDIPAFNSVYATFTPEADGTLTIVLSGGAPVPMLYTDGTFTEQSETSFIFGGNWMNKTYDVNVTAGSTYYIGCGLSAGMDPGTWQINFSAGGATVEMTEVSPLTTEILSAAEGMVYLTFNRPVSVKAVTVSANGASEALTPDSNSGVNVVVNVGPQMMEWYEAGKLAEGDELTLAFTGISEQNDPDKVVGEDGTITLAYKVAAAPLTLVGSKNTPGNGMDVFKSYIFSADRRVALAFDGEVSTSQLPRAELVFSSENRGGTVESYRDTLDVQVKEDSVFIYLGNDVRTQASMLPEYTGDPIETITLNVTGVCGLDGQYAYSGAFSSRGAFSFAYKFEEVEAVMAAAEFTPVSGSEIAGGDELEIWIMNESRLRYDGVQFTYGMGQVMTVPMSEITKTADPTTQGASTLTLSVPNLPADVSQVTVSLSNLEAEDGADYSASLSATYDYKEASLATLNIVSSTPAEGAAVEILTDVALQTDQDDAIGCIMISVYDLNPTSPDMACLNANEPMMKGEEGFTWAPFFAIEMYEGHEYEIRLAAYPTEADGWQGINAIGEAKLTVKGATKAFQYSPVTLVSVTPDPSEGFASEDDNVVKVTFSAPVEITAEGAFVNMGYGWTLPLDSIGASEDKTEWTFVIPQTAMTTGNAVMLSVAAKDADGLVVQGNTGFEVDSYFEWSYATPFNAPDLIVTPNNEEMQQTLKEFTVTVEGGQPIGLAYAAMEDIVVWDMFQATVATGTVELVIPEDKQADYEMGAYDPVEAKITLDQEITTAGRYTLHIPANYFMLGTLQTAMMNKDTNIRYSVEGVATPLVPTEVVPADKSTVSRLETVTLTMDCDVVTLLAIGEDADAFITVTNKDTNEEVDIVATVDEQDLENWTNMNQVVIRFSEPITAKGTYVLTIAPELFADDQWDPMFGTGSANAELTYEFTVDGSDDVAAVGVDEGKVTVYSLNGVKVLDNADRDALKTLKKGIYIVNGKKTVVK